MKSFFSATFLAICSVANAGEINILHISHTPSVSMEIRAEGKSQTITLESGSNSGSFTLPDAAATIALVQPAGDSLDVPATKAGSIAILFTKEKKPAWHLQSTKPNEGKNALRVLNLTGADQSLSYADQEHKIKAAEVIDLGETEKPSMKIKLSDGTSRSLKPEDRGAYLAVLYSTDEGTKIAFIAER
jgi:hypothetical protein